MNTNLSFNNNQFQVRLDYVGTEAQREIPPAGVHPVVAMQGKWTSFVSPEPFAQGVTVQLDSGFPGMPLNVHVESCVQTDGGYYIRGIIGG